MVNKELSEASRADTVTKLQETLKAAGISNLQLLCVWRHSPRVAVGIFSKVAESLGYSVDELFAFSEENMLQVATMGNTFIEKCPWARDEVFRLY